MKKDLHKISNSLDYAIKQTHEKKPLVIYNQMRVSTNIGAINRAYDDAIKKADINIEKKKRRKKNNPDDEL